jgi:hypothetical protein
VSSVGELVVDFEKRMTAFTGAAFGIATVNGLRAQSAQTSEVQLNIDKTVPYGRVAEAMAEIQKSELRSVSLAVQPAAPKIDTTPPATRN